MEATDNGSHQAGIPPDKAYRTGIPATKILINDEPRGVVLSAFEHRLDRTARTYLFVHRPFIGALESNRLRRGYRVPRTIELVYKRATSAGCGTVTDES